MPSSATDISDSSSDCKPRKEKQYTCGEVHDISPHQGDANENEIPAGLMQGKKKGKSIIKTYMQQYRQCKQLVVRTCEPWHNLTEDNKKCKLDIENKKYKQVIDLTEGTKCKQVIVLTEDKKCKQKQVIDLTANNKTYKPIEYWLKDLEVYADEKIIILEDGWIPYNIISAVLSLLKKGYRSSVNHSCWNIKFWSSEE